MSERRLDLTRTTMITDRRIGRFVLRTWRRPDWRPFLHRYAVVLAGGCFGFCFQIMRIYRAPARPHETRSER